MCARVRRAVAALFVVVCVSTGPSILNRDSERAGRRCGVGRRVLLQHTALVRPPVRPHSARRQPVSGAATAAARTPHCWHKDALVRDHLDKHWLLNVPLGFILYYIGIYCARDIIIVIIIRIIHTTVPPFFILHAYILYTLLYAV